MIIRKDIDINKNPTPEQIRMLERAIDLHGDDDHESFDSVEELWKSLNSEE